MSVDMNMAMQDVHHHIERGIDEARTALASARTGADADVGARLAHLSEVITRHHRAEDTTLFPRLRRESPDLLETASLEHDHEELVAVLSEMEEVHGHGPLGDSEWDALDRLLDRLDAIASRHFGREERELHPALRRLDVTTDEVSGLLGVDPVEPRP